MQEGSRQAWEGRGEAVAGPRCAEQRRSGGRSRGNCEWRLEAGRRGGEGIAVRQPGDRSAGERSRGARRGRTRSAEWTHARARRGRTQEEERRPRGKGKEEHAECGADSAREFRGEGRHEAARRGVRSARSGDVAVEGAERSAAKVVATVARARRERRREGGR